MRTPTECPPTPPLSELPTAFPDATCLRRGLCPVTSLRAQGPEMLESHSLYYEQHGPPGVKGDEDSMNKLNKVVFIMGLNANCFSWAPQVRHFGKGGEEGNCTALVFDNRGVGNSGYPMGPYTTSGMAEDIICLLDYLGWTGDRELNIVGASLGGMIAQELAYRIPNRIASLVLAVTTPGGHFWNNFPPWKGFYSLIKLLFASEPADRIPPTLGMLYPASWLAAKATSDPHAEFNGNTETNAMGKTNWDVQAEGFARRASIARPQQLLGHVSQVAAGLTHNVSPARLAYIAANIPKILIVTGDQDPLVRPSRSEWIKEGMDLGLGETDLGRVELVKWRGTGHGVSVQREAEFNLLVERCVREGRKAVEEGFKGRDL